MKATYKILLLVAVTPLLLVGCRKGQPTITSIPGKKAPPVVADMKPMAPPGPEVSSLPALPADGLAGKTADLEPQANPTGIPLAEDDLSNYVHDRDAFKADTVYFAYDSVVLRKDELRKLDSIVASFQNAPAACKIGIEGNCDERGTPEYNRSLGERRALAAREYFVAKGVAASRILTISYGEDKPATTGHDDSAWSKNRRDEFILLKPKSLAGNQ